MLPRDQVCLKDIIKYAYHIQRFVQGKTLEAFNQDLQCELAVLRCLEVIGEATTRISETFKQEHPEVPWRKMKNMWNIL